MRRQGSEPRAVTANIGQVRVTLRNQSGYEWDSTVYITEDQKESTLGKVDEEALGILITNLEGRPPGTNRKPATTPAPPAASPTPRRNRGCRRVR